MRLFSGACGAAVACALVTAASAETLNTAMDLPTGAVIDLVVEKHSERTGSQATPQMNATFRYRQAIVSTDEGYVVTQTLTGMEAPPEAKAVLEQAAGALKTITFETDASLAPVKVKNREALLQGIFSSAKSLTSAAGVDSPAAAEATDRAMTTTRAMFDRLSDEQLAQTLLKEQGALSQFQSVEIDLSKPVNEVIETPNPAGGAPFKQTVSIKLEAHDKKAERATISLVDELDPEALKANAVALLQQLAPEQRDKITAELASTKMETRNTCRYEMDLKTGLAARTDCTRTTTAMGGEGRVERKVERMIITQKLTLP